MKKVSVGLKKMRRERWSLESSGDEGAKGHQGFAPAPGKGVRSKQAAYRRLIGSLEQEVHGLENVEGLQEQEEDGLEEKPKVDTEEDVEGVPDITVQMVQDFSLESEESDEEIEEVQVETLEDDVPEDGDDEIEELEEDGPVDDQFSMETIDVQEDNNIDQNEATTTTEDLMEADAKETVPELVLTEEAGEVEEDPRSKATFLDSLRLQAVAFPTCSQGRAGPVSRKQLIQYHATLKELEQRSPLKVVRKKAKGLREYRHTEDFGSDELNRLVERMRRESRGVARARAGVVWSSGQGERVRVVERRRYWAKRQEVRSRRYEARLLRKEGGRAARLRRPSRGEEEKARKVASVPSHLFSANPRSEAPTVEFGRAFIPQEADSVVTTTASFNSFPTQADSAVPCIKDLREGDRSISCVEPAIEPSLSCAVIGTAAGFSGPSPSRTLISPSVEAFAEDTSTEISPTVANAPFFQSEARQDGDTRPAVVEKLLDRLEKEQKATGLEECPGQNLEAPAQEQEIPGQKQEAPALDQERETISLEQEAPMEGIEVDIVSEDQAVIDTDNTSGIVMDQPMEDMSEYLLQPSDIVEGKAGDDEEPLTDVSRETDVYEEATETFGEDSCETTVEFEEEIVGGFEIKLERGEVVGKRFQCMKCGKELNTKNGLDYHMRTHTGLSPFQCDLCFKRFKSSSLCSRHRQIHSSERKYTCEICSKSFAQKSNLSKHMDIHAGVKPFQVHNRVIKLVAITKKCARIKDIYFVQNTFLTKPYL